MTMLQDIFMYNPLVIFCIIWNSYRLHIYWESMNHFLKSVQCITFLKLQSFCSMLQLHPPKLTQTSQGPTTTSAGGKDPIETQILPQARTGSWRKQREQTPYHKTQTQNA